MTADQRNLRSRLAAATRWGNEAEAAECRAQLRLHGIEADLRRRLNGDVLSREQYSQIVELLLTFRDRTEVEAELLVQAAGVRQLMDRLTGGPEETQQALQASALENAV